MKRAGTQNQQFAKRIPADIRHRLVGRKLVVPLGDDVSAVQVAIGPKTESIRFSLQSNNPAIVKTRQATALAYVEEVFEALRANRPVSLSRPQAAALAGELYRAWAEPGVASERVVHEERNGHAERLEGFHPEDDEIERLALQQQAERFSDLRNAPLDALETQLGPIADRLLVIKGVMEVDADSRRLLLSNLAQALVGGFETRAKRLDGDYSADETAKRYPEWQEPSKHATQTGGEPKDALPQMVSLTGLVTQWWVEAEASGKSDSTRESYSNSFRLLSNFLGHDDATKVTPEDIIRFKDHRLKTPNPKTGRPVSAKTVKASDLTAFKSVFDWAVSNRKLTSNPATGVTIKLGKKLKVRERDFTNEEATAILTAASALAAKTPLSETNAMKRWVPWLCAYTGSRVGEMVQLRKEDVRQENGNWIITITPEAGTVKGKERRDVPIHTHLVEMGFVAFVEACKDGYLFMTIKPKKTFRGTWQSKKNRLTDFVRTVVTDPNVAPNHGWRHTFKTRGIEAGIQEKVLDAICGHAPATVGRAYGSVTLQTKVDAVGEFPRYYIKDVV